MCPSKSGNEISVYMTMPKVRRSGRKTTATRPYQAKGKPSSRSDLGGELSSPAVAKVGGSRSRESQSHGAMQLVAEIRRLCITYVVAHPECKENAVWMAKYMRNQFKFFGLKAPARRQLLSDLVKSHKEELKDRKVLLQLMPILWQQDERDFQCFGVDLLKQFRKEVLGASKDDFDEAVSCVEQLITNKSWWDTVDALSYPVIGYFVHQRPDHGVPLMNEWIKHDNMWLRRVALLHQIGLKEKTDADRLFQFSLQRAHEKEFFIRKAIGWSLREYSKTNGKAVREFVERNRDELASLSIKEATKYC